MKRESIMGITFTLLSVVIFTIGFFMGDISRRSAVSESQDYTDVRGNIDIEYLLEVTPDSIYIENYTSGRVLGGKYSDLDSLILIDNL